MTNFSMSLGRRRWATIGPWTPRSESLTAIFSGQVRSRGPCTCISGQTSSPEPPQGSWRPVVQVTLHPEASDSALESRSGTARALAVMFADLPSAAVPTLRTHVLITADITTCPEGAQCAGPGPLVPHARGRHHRRLGGRPERAITAGSPAPSAPAQGVREAPRGHTDARRAVLPLPCFKRSAHQARDCRQGPTRDARSRVPWHVP